MIVQLVFASCSCFFVQYYLLSTALIFFSLFFLSTEWSFLYWLVSKCILFYLCQWYGTITLPNGLQHESLWVPFVLRIISLPAVIWEIEHHLTFLETYDLLLIISCDHFPRIQYPAGARLLSYATSCLFNDTWCICEKPCQMQRRSGNHLMPLTTTLCNDPDCWSNMSF